MPRFMTTFGQSIKRMMLYRVPTPTWFPSDETLASYAKWLAGPSEILTGISLIIMSTSMIAKSIMFHRWLGEALPLEIFTPPVLGLGIGVFFCWLGARHTRQHLNKRRRAKKGLCANCGYDLRATPERCPECGRETKS